MLLPGDIYETYTVHIFSDHLLNVKHSPNMAGMQDALSQSCSFFLRHTHWVPELPVCQKTPAKACRPELPASLSPPWQRGTGD